MRRRLIFAILLMPTLVSASTQEDACKIKENRRLEMNLISFNIANVTTTRIPEGGPYRRKGLVCVQQNCEVKEDLKVLAKYEPDHPDADESGYVSYPDISLMDEMESMIQATRAYEEAAKECK